MEKPDRVRRQLLLAASSLLAGSVLNPFKPAFAAKSQDSLAFSEMSGLGPPLDAEYIERNLVPLHREVDITHQFVINENEFSNALKLLRQQFEVSGIQWKDSYVPRISEQHYGMTAEADMGKMLLSYCNNVTAYLEKRMPDLIEQLPHWDLLMPAPQAINNSVQAYVGKYNYNVRRFQVANQDGDLLPPYLITARPVERAVNFMTAGLYSYEEAGLIYVIGGITSLTAPFSEMLHLATHRPAIDFMRELQRETGYVKAMRYSREVTESLTEAAAISLSMDYMRILGRSDKLDMIVRHARSLNSQFSYFGRILSMMQSEGPSHILQSYVKDPFAIADQLV